MTIAEHQTFLTFGWIKCLKQFFPQSDRNEFSYSKLEANYFFTGFSTQNQVCAHSRCQVALIYRRSEIRSNRNNIINRKLCIGCVLRYCTYMKHTLNIVISIRNISSRLVVYTKPVYFIL